MRTGKRKCVCARAIFALTVQLVGLLGVGFGSTDFVVPPGRQVEPNSIIVGPDHNLWFTEFTGEKIGRITTSGTITQFPISGAQYLVGIANGPDGNIWFTDQFTGNVGHVDTVGAGLKEYTLPSGSLPQDGWIGWSAVAGTVVSEQRCACDH